MAAVDYDEGACTRRMQGYKTRAVKPDDRHRAAPVLSEPGRIGDEIVELKKMLKQLMAQGRMTPASPVREKLLASGIRESLVDLVLSKLGDDATEEG